jgi:ABC-type ATPase with predicted acetyltransferase domain
MTGWLDAYENELRESLADHVVDWRCSECGSTKTTEANWSEKPVCCGWEMIDLIGTVRRQAESG